MELPCRRPGDELLKTGELTDIRRRLRRIAPAHDLTSVIVCAFDHRTRMLPFTYADMRMVPAGVRAVGAALLDSGFEKTRIVLQQWNRNFRPSQMRLDGRVPDMLLISTMYIHNSKCRQLIRDARQIDPQHRPLIIVGGAKMIYEPWDAFGADPDDPWGADAAVTGEQYVLLNMLEVVLSVRGENESLRAAFARAQDRGMLDDVAGLVYARGRKDGVAEELVDTGVQRLVGNLDEQAPVEPPYGIIEPPGKNATLSSSPLPADKVSKLSPISCLVLTLGCRYRCPYCPIPAYNQRQFRTKSGGRILEDITRLNKGYGLRYYFGADDNFFNDKDRALEICDTLARAQIDGKSIRHLVRLASEVTVLDAMRMKDELRLVRTAGFRALWMGVEDMTATLVKKGQSVATTTEIFRILRARGIMPMPMMMHHDSQPLLTTGSDYGLLNQVRLVKNAGAGTLQVLMIIPSPGSKLYVPTYESEMVFSAAGGKKVRPYMHDGNYVVASELQRPWRKQFNILAAYLYFYNPLRVMGLLARPRNRQLLFDVVLQFIGMYGLIWTIKRTFGWGLRLMFGGIKRLRKAPHSEIPMKSPDGGRSCHALPGTPEAEKSNGES